ncbi:MAG: nitrilase-related carbon-nitrogen hydrolase [Planctomycetota bacterium]
MAFVGLILWVRFFRLTNCWLAVPLLTLCNLLVWEWAYAGMVPLPTFARIGMFTAISFVFAILFLADRWINLRTKSIWATMILPCGWVTFDQLSALFSPGGTWASIAYTFANDPTLSQLASIGGWTCITFFVVWIAAATNWVWDRWTVNRELNRLGVSVIAVVSIFVIAFGTYRLGTGKGGRPVRIACVVAPNTFNDEYLNEVYAYTRGIKVEEESTNRAMERIAQSKEEHFAMVENALPFDPDFIVWPEANAIMTIAEEESWIERAKKVAIKNRVHVGMGMSIFRPGTGQGTLNKFVLVDPDGNLAMDTLKATRVPGSLNVTSDGLLPVVESKVGRLSAAICFDMDFPHIIAQAGTAKVDLFFAPSNDWLEVRDIHAQMAKTRSIEQGFALVRPTKDGTTIITDSTGRTIASMIAADNETGIIAIDVEVNHRTTLYSIIGDSFGYANALLFLVLVVFTSVNRENNRKVSQNS